MTSLPAPSFGAHRRRSKQEVCDTFVSKLCERGDIDVSAPGFLDSIHQHFDRLPSRYAIDVNTDSLDVLSHKRLLDEARLDPAAVSFAVRPVDVVVAKYQPISTDALHSPTYEVCEKLPEAPLRSPRPCSQPPPPQPAGGRSVRMSTLPKPAFGSSPNLQVSGAGSAASPHSIVVRR